MTIPNDWHDATPASQWRLNEEYETASIEFTTSHGKIWWNGSLKSDKSIEYCREQLKKCGWNGDQDSRDLSTAAVRIKVGQNEKTGKQEVRAISAKGSDEQRPPKDPVKARSLAAKLSGRAASSGDAFGNAPQFDGRDPGGSSDDIPF